jgi:DHA1 family multidrug resistance protein-like MFS transporter
MSEVLGRRTPLLCGYALFALFQIPVAVAQNITTVCVGRFLGGFFAAAPLSVVGGILADLWDPIPRSYAICIFAAGGFAGPVAGPIAGGFIAQSHLGWRWTSWITLIMAAAVGALAFFFAPETSAPRILQYRAAALRKESGNNDYHAKADAEKLTMQRVLTVYLIRPFVMIVQEPILALVTAYMSFLYGIVYLLFEAVSPSSSPATKHRSAETPPVSRSLPRTTRLVPRRLTAPLYRLHRRHHPRCRRHRPQHRHKLHPRLQQTRQMHP